MGSDKQKGVFEYGQNAQIQIILCLRSLIHAFALHWHIL